MFASATSSSTSELLGAGGFASLGNGFGNDNLASSSGTSFDLNDFPSLGGAGSVESGSGLAAALREQQQLLAHQHMLQGGASSSASSGKGSNLYMLAMTGNNGNFSMANEDFPALGGGLPAQSSAPLNSGVVGGSSASGLNVSSLLTSNVQSSSSSENGPLYGGSGLEAANSVASRLEGGAAGLLAGAGLGSLGGLRTSPSAGSTTLLPSTAGSATTAPGAIGTAVSSSAMGGGSGSSANVAAGSALSGDYGLLGLLGVIRMTDADRNALALGTDLQLMGLNLGSTEQIYGTFSSPWSDVGVAKEPHYQVRFRLLRG
jgi:CCR4-NOT transcription complex subunit 2